MQQSTSAAAAEDEWMRTMFKPSTMYPGPGEPIQVQDYTIYGSNASGSQVSDAASMLSSLDDLTFDQREIPQVLVTPQVLSAYDARPVRYEYPAQVIPSQVTYNVLPAGVSYAPSYAVEPQQFFSQPMIPQSVVTSQFHPIHHMAHPQHIHHQLLQPQTIHSQHLVEPQHLVQPHQMFRPKKVHHPQQMMQAQYLPHPQPMVQPGHLDRDQRHDQGFRYDARPYPRETEQRSVTSSNQQASQTPVLATIGISLWQRGKYFVVAGVTPGSSAYNLGIRVGDVIRKVNRVPVKGWTMEQVQAVLTGTGGSSVLIRTSDLKVKVRRDCAYTPDQRKSGLSNGHAYDRQGPRQVHSARQDGHVMPHPRGQEFQPMQPGSNSHLQRFRDPFSESNYSWTQTGEQRRNRAYDDWIHQPRPIASGYFMPDTQSQDGGPEVIKM